MYKPAPNQEKVTIVARLSRFNDRRSVRRSSDKDLKHRANIRKVISILFLAVSFLFLFYPEIFPRKITSPFYLFLFTSLFTAIIPIERINYFKFKDLEASFEKEEVKAAITSLALSESENEKLITWLQENDKQVDILYNARILWIDDNQSKLLLLRRLLRSFGVNVLVASSSSKALEILNEDNDIDLIISDIQRTDFEEREEGAIELHDGVNFIRYLRTNNEKEQTIVPIAVLFYAAYDDKRLYEFIKPAEKLGSITEATNDGEPVDFITGIIDLLYRIRKSSPAMLSGSNHKKEPTSAG